MIVKKGNKFAVMDSKGSKVLGMHPTKEAAEKQLTAIHISQEKRKTFKEHLEESIALTLQYHDELNPDLWENNKIKPDVRSKLLQIAKVWNDFAKIPNEAVEDVLIVGGNANFNYTPFSDIDLHILVDKKQIADCSEILDEYLKDKKQLWAHSHTIKIYNHDVEVYAQDISEQTPPNQGCYSLVSDSWINEPKKEEVNLEDPELVIKIDHMKQKIDDMISSKSSDESFKKLKEKFKNMRSAGLKKAGEYSVENLMFKELRNLGYLDRVNDYILSSENEKLSLKK